MNIKYKNKVFVSTSGHLITGNIPIIYWDTCALLDIIRIPLKDRKELDKKTQDQYVAFAKWITNGSLISVTSDLVLEEFSHNYDKIRKQLDDQTKNLINSVDEQTDYMENAVDAARIKNELQKLENYKIVTDVAMKIWSNTVVIRSQKAFMKNADYRIRNYVKPSGGQESYKDCYIWVCFMELMNQIRPTAQSYFFTVNTADFAESRNNKVLHHDLQNEISQPNIIGVLSAYTLYLDLIGRGFRP